MHALRRAACALAIIALVALPAVAVAAPKIPESFMGVVLHVADGDTLTVEKCADTREGLQPTGETVKIRLAGIDAPEKSQAYGTDAGKYLGSLVLGKHVAVCPVAVDMYGRLVAEVCKDEPGEDGFGINQAMLEKGYAWCYRAYPHPSYFEEIEARAKAAKAGLWKQSKPQAPWDYRRAKKAARRAK